MKDKSFQRIPQDSLESRSDTLVFPKQAAGFLEIVIMRTVFPKSTVCNCSLQKLFPMCIIVYVKCDDRKQVGLQVVFRELPDGARQ